MLAGVLPADPRRTAGGPKDGAADHAGSAWMPSTPRNKGPRMAAKTPRSRDLVSVELAAMAGAIKGKTLSTAKADIPVGTHPVRFAVEVVGTVERRPDTSDMRGTAPAVVDLGGRGALLAVLAELGIGEVRFADALRAVAARLNTPGDVAHLGTAKPKLARVLAEVEQHTATRMGDQPTVTKGRAGAVSTDLVVSKIDLPGGLKAAA